MPFIKKFETIIYKSDKSISKLTTDNGVFFYNFDSDFNLISKKKILPGNYSFVDIWFDIDKNNHLYGLINTKDSSLLYSYINDKVLLKTTILQDDSDSFTFKFPYIKEINNETHILYYLNNKYNQYFSKLIHHYKKSDNWIKSEIDLIEHDILTNFVVIFKDSVPSVFYFNLVNGYDELFVTTFNINTNIWSAPLQITKTGKNKVYLSVIKDSNDIFHISYSENNSNRYYCVYLKGSFNNGKFFTSKYTNIKTSLACTFPHLIGINNALYIQWLEYHDLYTSVSINSGDDWSIPMIVDDSETSDLMFIRYDCKSNYDSNNASNFSNIFATELSNNSPIKIIGINKNENTTDQ